MSETISTGAIVIFLMLLTYMIVGAIIEKYEIIFGHEAAVTIILGKSFNLYISYNLCAVQG
jgi:hypothetical protein